MTNTELSQASKIMLGTQEAQALYIGNSLIWQKTSTSVLPSGYTQLDYISSTQTGGQYINLNCNLFQTTDDITINIKFNLKGGGKDYNESSAVNLTKPSILLACVSEADPYYAFALRKNDIGSSGTVNDNYVHVYSKWQISNSVYRNANGDATNKQKYYTTYLAGNISGQTQTPLNQIYEKTIIIDNLSSISSTIFNKLSNLPTYMFGTYNDSTATGNNATQWKGKVWRFSESDVYYCKIMKGTTVIRDLIPALKISDNSVGLYDIQNDVFYTSQGTDPFIAGYNNI